MTVPHEELRLALKKVPSLPGVYLYFNLKDNVIYVGKAVNLNRRVNSYFSGSTKDAKTTELVAHIARFEIIQTQDEYHALLLENQLIKQYRPKYNIALKDGKGYPFLVSNKDHKFPGLDYHLGPQKENMTYFGPYIAKKAVWTMLNEIQRVFGIRQCSDHFFKTRKRPCMLYQIKRCSGPCVGLISEQEYQANFNQAELFLKGKLDHVLANWREKMIHASQAQQFESAAKYRDLIKDYHRIAGKQTAQSKHQNIDVISAIQVADEIHLVLLWVRGGQLLGRQYQHFNNPLQLDLATGLQNFLCQYYYAMAQLHGPPQQITVDLSVAQFKTIKNIFKDRFNTKVIQLPLSSKTSETWLSVAAKNLRLQFKNQHKYVSSLLLSESELTNSLALSAAPERIECFDISHTSGQYTIASCVVFNETGPFKSEYRAYKIPFADKPDDYASLEYVFSKRFTKRKDQALELPDLIIVDGGIGQLHVLEKVLETLQLTFIPILAISKGPARKPGTELLHTRTQKNIKLSQHSQAFHLLMHIRDEAHRFAVLKHRKLRDKQSLQFIIEGIPGIGKQKRILLYQYFGGLQGIKKATVDELCQVKGINYQLATAIKNFLRHQP